MPAGSATTIETLHLLGGLSLPPSPSSVPQSPPIAEQQQLTIFYSGIVSTYENVPAAKAHAIMLLLADGDGGRRSDEYQSRSSTTQYDTKPTTGGGVSSRPPTLAFSTSAVTHEIIRKQKQLALRLQQRSEAELPFARKASLARFLKKRKDRVQAIKQAGSTSQEEKEVSHGDQCKKIKLSTTGSVPVSPPKRPSTQRPPPHFYSDTPARRLNLQPRLAQHPWL